MYKGHVNPFFVNLNEKTVQNEIFRTVFWGGNHLRFTWISILVGDDLRAEVYPKDDQFLWIKEGQGLVQMGNRKDNLQYRKQVYDNLVIFVPAGMWHHVINTGNKPLKLYSICNPSYERDASQNEQKVGQTKSAPCIEPFQKENISGNLLDLENRLNQWKGATIIFQGDSITDPEFNSDLPDRYPKLVCEYFGATEVNYAIGGSTIAMNPDNQTEHDPIISRFEDMQDEADLIIIAAGTNDWHFSWSPLGNFDSRDNKTFYGALHNLCLGLKKKYKNKTILFMTPIMRNEGEHNTPTSVNKHGKTLKEYGDMIKEVCHFYSIPVLDMYGESGLFPFNEELALEYYMKQFSEGRFYYTHPNNKGQIMMAKRLIGYLKQLY